MEFFLLRNLPADWVINICKRFMFHNTVLQMYNKTGKLFNFSYFYATFKTSMEKTNQQYDAVKSHCREVFSNKMNDYGTAWRILRPESITDQIYIKARRIRSIEENGITKVNEGILP